VITQATGVTLYSVVLVAVYALLAATTFIGPASQQRKQFWLVAWSVWVGMVTALVLYVGLIS
jgi:hypothetical protein